MGCVPTKEDLTKEDFSSSEESDDNPLPPMSEHNRYYSRINLIYRLEYIKTKYGRSNGYATSYPTSRG